MCSVDLKIFALYAHISFSQGGGHCSQQAHLLEQEQAFTGFDQSTSGLVPRKVMHRSSVIAYADLVEGRGV
jgi:hypothetical protein